MLFLGVLSCSTPPEKPKLSLAEQIKEDSALAASLFSNFEKRVVLIRDSESENYLNAMTLKLSRSVSDLATVPIQVFIYKETKAALSPRFFSFPGIRIYVPDQFLATVEYENVLAAALSLQMQYVIQRSLAKRVEGLSEPENVQIFGQSSVFLFNREERAEAIQSSISWLYNAYYDPRGMVSFFNRFYGYDIHSENDAKELEFDLKAARLHQSERVPLPNPILRSDTFLTIQKKWARWAR